MLGRWALDEPGSFLAGVWGGPARGVPHAARPHRDHPRERDRAATYRRRSQDPGARVGVSDRRRLCKAIDQSNGKRRGFASVLIVAAPAGFRGAYTPVPTSANHGNPGPGTI